MNNAHRNDLGQITQLQAALRLSSIYLEMLTLAERLEHPQAKIVRYSANVLGLLRQHPIRADAAEVLGIRKPLSDAKIAWLCHGKPGPPGGSSS